MERLALVLVLAGLVWRIVRYLLNFPMWGDEAFLAMSLLVRDFHTVLTPPLERSLFRVDRHALEAAVVGRRVH